jgi:hypothetical protein
MDSAFATPTFGRDSPILQRIEDRARAASLGIAPHCASLLDRLAAMAEQAITKTPNREQEVLQAVDLWIDEMITEARRLGLPDLHEQTFEAARLKLCPIFPFC